MIDENFCQYFFKVATFIIDILNNTNEQEKFLKDLIDGIQTSEMIMSILILLASHTMSELALII